MAQFTVPAASKKYSIVIEAFRGVDLNNSPSNVDKSRSPEAPNMIRDQVGKVRKRTGYTTMVTAYGNAAINGIHRLNGPRRRETVPAEHRHGRHVDAGGHRGHGGRQEPQLRV